VISGRVKNIDDERYSS